MKDAIQFKVTISAIVEREQTIGRDWVVLSEEIKPGESIPTKVFGYSPEITKTVRKEIQVFEQTVETLDMAALVSVVNGLKP